MRKTALIVDDSPLARHVLSQLLTSHGITAATAPSAEEALDYLKYHRPDVVFMDHLMPGMDGFEALEVIKANPVTATIPVMMYTSQEGELYVGQARALGAFGVLPKDLKPTEVTKVLRALKLIPHEAAAVATSAPSKPGADTGESQNVKVLLEELFYQQRSALREEIRDGYQRAVASVQMQAVDDVAQDSKAGRSPRGTLLAAVLGLLAVVFGLAYFGTSRELTVERERSADLQALAAESSRIAEVTSAPVPAVAAATATPATAVAAVEWAFNLSGQYPFGESPLNDEQAQRLDRLLRFLDQLGFSGVVALDVHVGQFCVELDDGGDWRLVRDSISMNDCEPMALAAAEADARSRRQSRAFANTVVMAAQNGGTRVELSFHGAAEPAVPYPSESSFVTAGEWNAVAAVNQRIETHFLN